MIKDIITYLNLKLENVGYFNTIHCLADQVKKGDKVYPAIYNGANEYQDIALNDNLGSIAYWRKIGNVSISEQENKTTSNGVEYLTAFNLRLVCFVKKENGSTNDQYFADNLSTVIISNLTTNSSALKQAMKAKKVSVIAEQYVTDGREVVASEFENVAYEPNYSHSLFSIDFKVSIITNNQCFSDLCTDTPVIFTPSVTNNGYCTRIIIKTAAEWALDNTVYSERTLLVTSDEYYGATDQRKFKLSDGVQTWSQLDYMPIGSGATVDETLVVQTAAQWAVDATVYTNKRILVTSDEYYGSTDQRKFKIADGTQTWSQLDYVPISQTLAEVLANGKKTNELPIESNNAKAQAYITDTSLYLQWVSANAINQLLLQDSVAALTFFDIGTNKYGSVGVNSDRSIVQHSHEVHLDAPLIKLSQGTASRIVETDASKNLTYVAKNNAYNKNYGTGAGTTCEGNDTRIVKSSFDISFDGQGGVLTVNAVAIKRALANGGTITGFSLKGDVSGSVEIDMKKNGVSMVGAGTKLDLISASSDSGTISGWTSSTFVADDQLEWVVSSATTITKVWLTVKYDKTS